MPAGNPPLYNNPKDLQSKIDSYFTEDNVKPTISGLAYHLGFESRQSFYDYEERIKFSYTIKRARLKIEMSYESKLHGNNVAGPIFALKNMGWKDVQGVEYPGGIPITGINYIVPNGDNTVPDK